MLNDFSSFAASIRPVGWSLWRPVRSERRQRHLQAAGIPTGSFASSAFALALVRRRRSHSHGRLTVQRQWDVAHRVHLFWMGSAQLCPGRSKTCTCTYTITFFNPIQRFSVTNTKVMTMWTTVVTVLNMCRGYWSTNRAWWCVLLRRLRPFVAWPTPLSVSRHSGNVRRRKRASPLNSCVIQCRTVRTVLMRTPPIAKYIN